LIRSRFSVKEYRRIYFCVSIQIRPSRLSEAGLWGAEARKGADAATAPEGL